MLPRRVGKRRGRDAYSAPSKNTFYTLIGRIPAARTSISSVKSTMSGIETIYCYFVCCMLFLLCLFLYLRYPICLILTVTLFYFYVTLSEVEGSPDAHTSSRACRKIPPLRSGWRRENATIKYIQIVSVFILEIKSASGFPGSYIDADQSIYISFVVIAEGFRPRLYIRDIQYIINGIIIADLHHTAVHLGLAIHVLYSGCCLQNQCYNLVLRMLQALFHTSSL